MYPTCPEPPGIRTRLKESNLRPWYRTASVDLLRLSAAGCCGSLKIFGQLLLRILLDDGVELLEVLYEGREPLKVVLQDPLKTFVKFPKRGLALA